MQSSEIRQRLLQSRMIHPSDLIGCLDVEIDAYFGEIGVKVPASYRDYLLAIGHGAGKFLLGTEAFFTDLPIIRKEAERLLFECGIDVEILSDTIVFYMHQGYEFGYFSTTESDAPPVYQYIEGDHCAKIVWPSFSDYLLDMIQVFLENTQDVSSLPSA